MSGKLNTDWDVESYRHAWDSDEQWDMRRQFILAHKDTIPEKRLVCLAQVYANIQILGCKYPAAVMTEVNELVKAVPGNKFEERLKINREKKHFVKAKSSSGNFSVPKGKQGCARSQSTTPELKRKSPETDSAEPIKEAKKPRVEKCDPVQPIADSVPMYGYYTSGYKSKMVSEDPDYCGDPKVQADLKAAVDNDSSKQIANLNKGKKATLGKTDRLGKKTKTLDLIRKLEKRVQLLEKGLTESAKRTIDTSDNNDKEQRQGVDGNRDLEVRKFAWAGMLLKSFFADGKNVRKHTVSALEIAQLEFNDRTTAQKESDSKIWTCELNIGGQLFCEGKGISQKAAKLSTYTCAMNKLFTMVSGSAIVPPDLDFFGLKLDMDDSTENDIVLTERDRLHQAGKILAALVTNNSNVVQIACKIFAKLKLPIHLQTKAVEKQYESTLLIGESLWTTAQAKTTEFSVLRAFRCTKKNLIDMVSDEMCAAQPLPEVSDVHEDGENERRPEDGNIEPKPMEVPLEPQPPSPLKSVCPVDEGDEEERLLQAGRILAILETNGKNLTKVMNKTLKKLSLDISLNSEFVEGKYKSDLHIGNSISATGTASKEKLATLIALRRAKEELVQKAQLADSSPAIKANIKEQPAGPTLPFNLPSASVKLEDVNCENMRLLEVGRSLKTKKIRRNTVRLVMKNTLREFGVSLQVTYKWEGDAWQSQICIGKIMYATASGRTKKQANIQAFCVAEEKLLLMADEKVCLNSKESPALKVKTDNSNACSKIVVEQLYSQQKEQLLQVGKILQTCVPNQSVVRHVTKALNKFNIQSQVTSKKINGQWMTKFCIGGETFSMGKCIRKKDAITRAHRRAKIQLIRMAEKGCLCIEPKEIKSVKKCESQNNTALPNGDEATIKKCDRQNNTAIPNGDESTVKNCDSQNNTDIPNGDESGVLTKLKKREMRKSIDEIQRLLQVGKRLREITTDKNIVKVMRETLKEFGFKVCIKKKMTETKCKVFLHIGQSVHTVGLAKKDKVVSAKKRAFLRAKEFLVSQAACEDCEVEPGHEDPLVTPPTCSDAANEMIDLTQDDSHDRKPDLSCINANSDVAAEGLHDELERLILAGRILMTYKLNMSNIFLIMTETLKHFNIKIHEQVSESTAYCKVELYIGQSVVAVGISRPQTFIQGRYQAYVRAKDQLVLMASCKGHESNQTQALKPAFPPGVNATVLPNVAHVKPSGITNTCTSTPMKCGYQSPSTNLVQHRFQSCSDQMQINTNVPSNNQPTLPTFHPSEFVIIERPNCTPQMIFQQSIQYCKVPSEFKFNDISPDLKSCEVHVCGRKIVEVARPAATSPREFKSEAELKALEVLRTIAYTVKVKQLDDLIGMEITPDMLNNFVKSEACSSQETAIEDSNIGNRLLRLMGWKGGGLGKEGQKGIEEPIKTYKIRQGRKGLGSVPENNAVGNAMDNLKYILKKYARSKDTFWIKLSADFTKEERAIVHSIVEQLHLVSKSQGKNENRFMMIRRRSAMKGLKSMNILTKPSDDYEVIPPTAMRQ